LKNKGKKELIEPSTIMILNPYQKGGVIARVAPALTPDQWLKAIADFKKAKSNP
jgi:hypothetical protein